MKRFKTSELSIHPLNEALVPQMSRDEFEALKLDLTQRGQEEAIVIQAGTNLVVDGRNRLKAFIELDREEILGREKEFSSEEDLVEYILTRTTVHRHLTKHQKAALGAEYVERLRDSGIVKKGRPKATLNSSKMTNFSLGNEARDIASRIFGVSNSYIQTAIKLKSLAPDSFLSLKEGDIDIKEAQKIIASIEKEQEKRFKLTALAEKRELPDWLRDILTHFPTQVQNDILSYFDDQLCQAIDTRAQEMSELRDKTEELIIEMGKYQQSAVNNEDKVKKLEAEKEELEFKIKKLKAKMETAKPNAKEGFLHQISKLNSEILEIDMERKALLRERNELEEKFNTVKQDRDRLLKKINNIQAELDRRIREEVQKAKEQVKNTMGRQMERIISEKDKEIQRLQKKGGLDDYELDIAGFTNSCKAFFGLLCAMALNVENLVRKRPLRGELKKYVLESLKYGKDAVTLLERALSS